MKYAILLLGAALSACQPQGTPLSLQAKLRVEMDSRTMRLAQIHSQELFDVAAAETRLKVATLDARTQVVRAKAAAQENELIQRSFHDKSLIKRWTPATASSSIAVFDSGGVPPHWLVSNGTAYICDPDCHKESE